MHITLTRAGKFTGGVVRDQQARHKRNTGTRRREPSGVFFCGKEVANDDMELDFSKLHGLIPAVIQDASDGEVLMVGFMNQEALDKTVETGKVTFYSRTRNRLWTKGSTSGHYLLTKEIRVDCDQDTVLIRAELLGSGVCHNGFRTCFYRRLEDGEWKQCAEQTYDPGAVY